MAFGWRCIRPRVTRRSNTPGILSSRHCGAGASTPSVRHHNHEKDHFVINPSDPIVAYVDGGARGNPGPRDSASEIERPDGDILQPRAVGPLEGAMSRARAGVCARRCCESSMSRAVVAPIRTPNPAGPGIAAGAPVDVRHDGSDGLITKWSFS